MRKNLKKLTLLLAAMSLLSIVCATRAEADFKISITANENGFSMRYRLPLIANGFINLQEVDQVKPINISLFFIPIATINLSIAEFNAEAPIPSLKLHYSLIGSLPSIEPAEGDLVIPFCEAGLDLGLFKMTGAPVVAEHDIKAFLLLKNDSSKYDISVEMDNITAEASGEASSDSPTVTSIVTLGDQEYEVQLTFDYSNPLVTKCTYTIPMDEEDPIESTITLPNGRYKLWVDLAK